MERMKHTGDYELDRINMLEQECADLEEENKNLKLIQETNENQIKNDIKERDELREENKKLNIKVASLEGEIKGLNYTIEKLREELSAYDREYYDEDKKAKNIYKKQNQRSMGFSDFGGYDE